VHNSDCSFSLLSVTCPVGPRVCSCRYILDPARPPPQPTEGTLQQFGANPPVHRGPFVTKKYLHRVCSLFRSFLQIPPCGPLLLPPFSLHSLPPSPSISSCRNLIKTPIMPEKGVSEVEETFEFIQTPPAKEPAPPSTECGVRTTAVRKTQFLPIWSIDHEKLIICLVSCHCQCPPSRGRS
jgi:hypothetical protein